MARICMLVCSHYPDDPRPRREAEALVEAGHSVDIVCLRKDGQPARETIRGVTAHRLPLHRERAGVGRYLWDYARLHLLAFFKLASLHAAHRFDLVHIHNMPESLVFSALVPRLTGARILLDLHDPTPEVYQTKMGITPESRAHRLLAMVERWSIRFADRVITPNRAFQDVFVGRGCPPTKISIVMNSPQETVFAAPSGPSHNGNGHRGEPAGFRVMFHGGVYERHGIDTALEAVHEIRDAVPGLHFDVFGTGDYVPQFRQMVVRLGLGDVVTYHDAVPLETIAAAILRADIGLIPNKRTPFTEINFPTRIFEYLCMGRPVIAPRTRGIRDYFGEDELFFFEPGDPASLADTLMAAYQNPSRRRAVLEKGRAVYRKYRWTDQRREFTALVESMVE